MYITQSSDAVHALWSERCVAATVRRVHRVIVGAYDEALRPHGITVAQLDLLMSLLTAQVDVRPIDMARELHMDRSTLSRNLNRLQARGLVTTRPGANARESYVEVTPAGRQVAEHAAHAWNTAQQATRRQLGDDGIAALDTLDQILTNA